MSFDAETNRRRFLQFLAASPLLAAGAGPALADTLLLPRQPQLHRGRYPDSSHGSPPGLVGADPVR